MTTPTKKFYPSAPLENNILEQRVEKKLKTVHSLFLSIISIEERITFFEDENYKSKKR